jgi:NADH-quinone oxidoreductase subunit H
VRAQGGWPWEWYLFHNPFTFCAFFIYFISALAEGNRTPFDLPEAESELVSGYNTEYSGFRFALFPLVEWVNLFIIGAVAGMLFCGGWNVPGLSYNAIEHHWQWGLPGFHMLVNGDSWKWQLLGFGAYLAKILFFIFVTIWIRWTLPRFRVDQMMNLCWKYFIPLSFACFVGTLAFAWLLPAAVQTAVHVLMFLVGGIAPAYVFIQRVRYNRGRYRELRLNPML